VLLLALGGKAQAWQKWHKYVTNDAAGVSGSCAFATIQKGINTALAGSTVIVDAGDYTAQGVLSSANSGSSGNLITIQAAPGATVKIARITVSNNYVVIQGFAVMSPGSMLSNIAGIVLSGSYDQALHNTIYGNCQPWVTGEGCNTAIYTGGAYNTIAYNTIDGQNNSTTYAFGIGMYFDTTSSYTTASYNTFQGMNSPGRVFEIYGSFNRITHNEVKNCSGEKVNLQDHPDIFQTFGSAGSHDQTIENNYFHDFGGQIGNLEANGNYPAWYHWVFRNNVFANIGNSLFMYFPVSFYNNTSYNCASATGVNRFPLYACYANGAITSKNNAFVASGTSIYNGWYACGSGDNDFVSNSVTGGTKSGFNEPHGINGGNPHLITLNTDCVVNSCNFGITGESALKGQGVNLYSTFTTDYADSPRPSSGAWDIGALVYSPIHLMPPVVY